MRNRWWWRPDWEAGRRFSTWHATFAQQPGVCRFIDAYRRVLRHVGSLDPVPDQWLHLTMQGPGFTDEVDENEIAEIVEAAQRRLAALPSFGVTFSSFDVMFSALRITPEAVECFAQPAGPVCRQSALPEVG
ncbi:2'-5' RNA ligase family protein [Streptomyces iconiensis]|uniref:2'-5' RNA ligase superfamily protein n=1 Tax=Streptomyces iconiensis TaxID=1384038 RepID=A0ABT7A381_9ACTN|nr:2'-5' RNA ligase family protein [Streptomyces iconiensis]MDJ1135784.1 hypothetical protein [Streptomyces iconiensis]